MLPRSNSSLSGTTLRVYRYLFRQGGKPVGVHEVQSELGLSSPSVAHYHIRKLVDDGLVKEGPGGYVVDRFLFENMLRIRSSIIPFQTTFLAIFLTSLFLSLTFFRAQTNSGEYLFALAMNLIAVGIFSWETFRAVFRTRV
jgi:predicted DNA-binding transcriptional regulator